MDAMQLWTPCTVSRSDSNCLPRKEIDLLKLSSYPFSTFAKRASPSFTSDAASHAAEIIGHTGNRGLAKNHKDNKD